MKKQTIFLALSTLLLTGACCRICKPDYINDQTTCTKKEVVLFTTGTTFAFDSADLSAADKAGLNKLISDLKLNPEQTVTVVGYTDNIGNAAYNVDLSKRRATTVANYLTANGIASKRVSTVGRGAANPVASNDTAEGRKANRRAEVVMNK